MCNVCDTNKYIAIEAVLSKHDEEAIGNLVTSIQRVRNLHAPKDYIFKLGTIVICSYCKDDMGNVFVAYPCPTIKALEGETE